MGHVRDVGLRLDVPNRWDAPLVLGGGQNNSRRSMSSSGTPDSPRAGSMSAAQAMAMASGGGSGGSSSAGGRNTTFMLLPPDEFLPFVVPFQGGAGVLAGGPAAPHATAWRQMAPALSGKGGKAGDAAGAGALYLYPLPPEYERALHKKLAMTSELRHKFRQASLPKERERELNDAIQGHFKEWLAANSMLRQIYDLSNLEKDEVSAAGGSGPGSADGKEKVLLAL